MIKKTIVLSLMTLSVLAMPVQAQAGPIGRGLRAAGRGVVKVLRRVAHPFRRGC
jgi:hypothetical protein